MSWSKRIEWKKLILLAAAVALVTTACTSASVNESADGPIEYADNGGDAVEPTSGGSTGERTSDEGASEAPDDLADGTVDPVVFDITALGRDIIFTAEMRVAVDDVAAAGAEATRVIQGLGGFLFGQETSGSPNAQSVLTFRVDPDEFHEALARLGSIGEVRTQTVSASDVTERVVDLESQITTAAASVERLRALLVEATEIKQIVELENELLVRETQLESLRGQLRSLQDQVALATIVVVLSEASSNPEVELTFTGYPGFDDGAACPADLDVVADEGSETTLCFEIVNVGDTNLADLVITDTVLDLETDDFLVVFGDPEAVLQPGDSVVLAAEIVVDRDIRTRTVVTARPVNEDGSPIGAKSVTQTRIAEIAAVDPGGIPTFSEGLERSWEFLTSLLELLVLIAGAAIPFLWIPLVVWLVVRQRRAAKVTAEPAVSGDTKQ